MRNFVVPEDLLMAVGSYLISRPMGEVEQLVLGLRGVKELESPPPEPQPPKE